MTLSAMLIGLIVWAMIRGRRDRKTEHRSIDERNNLNLTNKQK